MTTQPPLTQEDALRAYARMMHNLSTEHLEPLLADDFHYASQWVYAEITSKRQYLDYIGPKIETIRKSGMQVWAELAEVKGPPGGPCLIMAQDTKDNQFATVRVKVEGDRIKRLDMCMVPPPESAAGTGEYPA